MTERITQKDLDNVLENLNYRLDSRRKEIHAQGRNGYIGLDEYRRVWVNDGWKLECMRTLFTGTKRECYEACWHMIRGIDLLS